MNFASLDGTARPFGMLPGGAVADDPPAFMGIQIVLALRGPAEHDREWLQILLRHLRKIPRIGLLLRIGIGISNAALPAVVIS